MRLLKRMFGRTRGNQAQVATISERRRPATEKLQPPESPMPSAAEKYESTPAATQAACPYCGVIINPPPVRTRKCPECREKIVRVRRWQRESDQAPTMYLTEAQAAVFYQEQNRYALRDKAIQRAERIRVDCGTFKAREKKLQKEMPGSGPRDVLWDLATLRALSLMKRGHSEDWHALSQIYFHQALWLSEEGRDKHEWWNLKRESNKAQARSYMLRGIETVEIMAKDCEGCRAFAGKRYPVEEAIENWPIPESACTAEWCSCMWNLVPPWETID